MNFVLTCIFLSYLCYTTWVTKCIPKSLSQTYYLLGNKGWMFQLIMIVLGIGVFFPWIQITPDNLLCLPFLACGSLLFVALAPQFKLRLDGIVHYSAAVVCVICAVLWMLIQGYTLFPHLIVFLILTLIKPSSYMWWLECIVAFAILEI